MLVPLAACGGAKSTTDPSPTTTGVSVTLSSPIRMGQTAQATGTETLSNGQTGPVTTGWSSDAPAVATVSDSGLVNAIGNGRASIYVVKGGRQGQQLVRVVPDYHGRWSGGLRVTSCTETGVFATIGFCDDYAVGATYGYTLSLSQSGEQMSAIVDYGESFLSSFPSIAAPIGDDGSSAFTPSISVTNSGVTWTTEAAFTINSTRVDQLTGTVNEVWRFPNLSGEGRLTQDIVRSSRTGIASLSSTSEGRPRSLSFLRRLAQRRP